MSADNKSILRSGGTKTVEDIDLPKWDRQGNLVAKPVKKKPVVATKIEDVKEEVVKVPTAKEMEAIREEAYNEGFEQGYQNGLGQGQREGSAAGRKEGLQKGQEEGLLKGAETGREQALAEERSKTDEKLTVLSEMSNALKSQVNVERDELEKALTALAIRIARQTLQDELRLKPSHISNVVHAAIQCLPNPDEKLTLFLNPSEVDFVETFADSQWQLQADDSVTAGGCKVKSAYSYVDYTLEHRFENAVSHLLTTLPDVNVEKVKQPLSDDFLTHANERDVDSDLNSETKAEIDELENGDDHRLSSESTGHEIESETKILKPDEDLTHENHLGADEPAPKEAIHKDAPDSTQNDVDDASIESVDSVDAVDFTSANENIDPLQATETPIDRETPEQIAVENSESPQSAVESLAGTPNSEEDPHHEQNPTE